MLGPVNQHRPKEGPMSTSLKLKLVGCITTIATFALPFADAAARTLHGAYR